MTADEALALALDGLLDRPRGAVTAADLEPELARLLEMANALRSLPAVPGPESAFRAALADRLRLAAAPRALAAENGHQENHQHGRLDSHQDNLQDNHQNGLRNDLQNDLQVVHALDAWLAEPAGTRRAPEAALPSQARPLAAVAAALEALPGTLAPSPQFRRSLARRLLQAPPPRALRPAAQSSGAGWRRRAWKSTAFAGAAAATILVFLTVGATYASAHSLPGQPLYPLKRGVETARLWLADNAAGVGLHTQFADRRLDEALAVPPQSGSMLAEFSGQATAALSDADRAVAQGDGQAGVVLPLLGWFRSARGRLVAGQPQLPPMAWRAALALVDEAIRALSSDHPFAVAPVPRLQDGRLLLAARRGTRTTDRLRPGLPTEPAAAADTRDADASPGPVQVVVVQPAGGWAAGAGSQPQSVVAPPVATSHPTAPTGAAEPTRRHPRPTAADVPPGATEQPRATAEPPSGTPPAAATSRATERPTGAPSESPTDSPTVVRPTPTAADTPGTTPTVPVLNKPPTILDVRCDDEVIDLYGSTTCHVVAVDPEGLELHYLWVADAPQMVNERQKDAVYYAAWGIGGGKMRVGIAVYVSDHESFQVDDPDVSRGETAIQVRSLDAVGR